MSSKRAKRHQLIVRVSNDNRAQNKRAGRKFHEIYIKFFCIPEVRLDLKPRYRNIKKELRRWYCGRKLSAAFDEYIKQTANADDEIKTMQGYAALVDNAEKRIAKMLKEGAI